MHFKKIRNIIIAAGVGLIAWQCSSSLYIPTEANVAAGTTLQELQQGRTLYVNNCGSCHNLHRPEEFNAVQWNKQLDEMQVKAKINAEQRSLIYKYLTSAGMRGEAGR